MYRSGVKAYQRTQKLGLSEREAEAMAFSKAAHLLDAASNEDIGAGKFRNALKYNQRLWTLVQGEMVKESGRLPADLKADLLSLSVFVDKQTVAALMDRDLKKLKPLVQINKNIAHGLLTAQA